MKSILLSVSIFLGAQLFAQVTTEQVPVADALAQMTAVADSVKDTVAVANEAVMPTPVVTPVATPTPPPSVLATPAAEQKTSEARSDKSSTFDGGLYLRAGYMIPSSDYMTGNAKNGYDFQMGSQFYIGPTIANFMRFGLDVTWYDFAYAELEMTNGTKGYSGLASAFGVGPMVSFAPAKHFVINTYVKALPTFAFSAGEEDVVYYLEGTETTAGSEEGFVGRGGFCIAGVWGLELRYRMFEIGYEMNWGQPTVAEVGSNVTDVVAGKFGVSSPVEGRVTAIDPFKINNSRLYIGIKF